MATKHARVTVDDTRDLVATGRTAGSWLITNRDTTDSVYLGDVTVTAEAGGSPGYELPAGESMAWAPAKDDDELYGICAAGKSAVLHQLRN